MNRIEKLVQLENEIIKTLYETMTSEMTEWEKIKSAYCYGVSVGHLRARKKEEHDGHQQSLHKDV